MHPLLRLSYEGVAQLARAAAALAPPGGGKTRQALRARRAIRSRYAGWAAAWRDARRPLLWMHAPSVGEGLQARPVLQRLREVRPELQLAYTFFSPSAERFARALKVDFADYLPFDSAADARAALDALQPRVLVFSKLDVWPTLTREAALRRVRLGLISATLSAESGRRSRLGTALLRDAYARLEAVGAIDEEDAARLAELGVRESVITVTGDTRYDQVWARAQGVDREAPLLAALRSDRPTLVAGSTWPADESVLLSAWRAVRWRFPHVRLVIAPHEPTPAHVTAIERWASDSSVPVARLDSSDAARTDVVIIDRVGVLGDLYALADVAFIGGGFHSAGLHSVLEPAAFGVPVLFGPRFNSSRDARLLLRCGGGTAVASRGELSARLERWLTQPEERREAGAQARALVHGGLGAAERSVALVSRLLAD